MLGVGREVEEGGHGGRVWGARWVRVTFFFGCGGRGEGEVVI